MDITSIVNLIGQSQSYAAQSGQVSPSASSDAVTAAFKKAGSRVEQQLGSTKVQLSAYGQIKSSLAEVQTAGKALGDAKQTATATDVKKAASAFVDAYNKASQTLGTAIQGEGKQPGALANDSRARFAASDLRRSVTAGSSLVDLNKIGITQNKNGSLAVDTKALESAFQANPDQVRTTLASLGGQAEKTATRELAKGGNVGGSVEALGNRSRSLEAQQNTQQAQIAAAQQIVDQQSTRLNSLSNAFTSGIAAYQRTFGG